VPVVLFVLFLLFRYWKYRPLPRLLWMALIIVIGYLLVMSGFAHWWGGASFGPRFSTDMVPWLVLLSIVGVQAMLQWREAHTISPLKWKLQQGVGLVLLLLSVFINARGAVAIETWKWNENKDIEEVKRKLWDWRQPQFLTGLVRPPLDREYPLISPDTHIDFSNQESNKFVWYGWSGPEDLFRWSDAKESALVFALNDIQDLTLKMKATPFLYRGLSDRQRIVVHLNGKEVGSFTLTEADVALTIALPKELLRNQNVLTFEFPDANSPELLKISDDERPLGIAVYWVEFLRVAPEGNQPGNQH
jgi:hypothetical protein